MPDELTEAFARLGHGLPDDALITKDLIAFFEGAMQDRGTVTPAEIVVGLIKSVRRLEEAIGR